MTQPNLLFTSASFERIKLWVLYKPPMKATGGISDIFVHFSCRLQPYYPRFFGWGHVFGLEII